MKKKLKYKTVIILTAVLSSLMLVGCTGKDSYDSNQVREAISNQDYNGAKSMIKADTEDVEMQKILKYIKYEDNMLLAAFWEDDYEAMTYIAPIINDIEKEDARFNTTVLVLAAAWGKTGMVKLLIENKADPNASTDKDGMTALMWACKSHDDQFEMVKTLLEAGANINATSNHGETSFSIAKRYKNENIIALIEEYMN